MDNLIEQLKTEHASILERLIRGNELGLGTDDGYREAWAIKDILSSHLLKEDRLFYPALRRAAKNNDDLQILLVTLDDDIKAVGSLVDEFYSSYTVKTDLPGIADKFTFVFEKLRSRMKNEEDFLFDEFLKLNDAQ